MSCPTLDELPAPPPGKTGWPWTEASPRLPETMPGGAPWPKISIVTPSYNQGQFIEETIRSVLLQGYPNLEYIVIDGGSTDQTVSILEKYDPWIDYWRSGPDDGQSSAINAGFQKASGTLGTWLNSDDMFFPKALRTVGRYFAEHSSCRFLAGEGILTSTHLEEVHHVQRPDAYSKRELLNYPGGQYLPQPSVFFELDLFEQASGVKEDLHYTMDLDLWIRMRERACLHYLPERLSMTRKHANTKTHGDNQKVLREAGVVIRCHASSLASPYILSVLLRLRARQAEGLASQALDQYFGDSHVSAAVTLGRAILWYPPVAFTRRWISVLARLILPRSVQSLFLHRH